MRWSISWLNQLNTNILYTHSSKFTQSPRCKFVRVLQQRQLRVKTGRYCNRSVFTGVFRVQIPQLTNETPQTCPDFTWERWWPLHTYMTVSQKCRIIIKVKFALRTVVAKHVIMLTLSHLSTHLEWNSCEHGNTRRSWRASKSHMHTTQEDWSVVESCFISGLYLKEKIHNG